MCLHELSDDPTYVCPNKADWKYQYRSFLKADYRCDYHLNNYKYINKSIWKAIEKKNNNNNNNNNNTFINN